jgi:hypothetical protein
VRGIAGTDVCQCSSYVYGDEAACGKGFDQEVNRCRNLVGHHEHMNVRVSDSVEGCKVSRVEQVKVWTAFYWHYTSGDMMVEGIDDLFHEMASQVRMNWHYDSGDFI